MGKEQKLKLVSTPARAARPKAPGPQLAALERDMFKSFEVHHSGAFRHTESWIRDVLRVVQGFLTFTGKHVWELHEEDFDRWCLEDLIKNRKVSVRTQQKYAGCIYVFFSYVRKNERLRNEVRSQFDTEVAELAGPDATIPHRSDDYRSAKKKRRFSEDEQQRFFDSLREEINHCLKSRPLNKKVFFPLARDYCLFRLMSSFGARRMEPPLLNIDSFSDDPSLPAQGAYACVKIEGKGSKGQGHKVCEIPSLDPQLGAELEHYIQNIRPYFLKPRSRDEKALFLSERGHRLSVSAISNRFTIACRRAKLDPRGTHSIRRTTLSGLATQLSAETLKRFARHELLSTTQKYILLEDRECAEEIVRVIERKEQALQNRQGKKGTHD